MTHFTTADSKTVLAAALNELRERLGQEPVKATSFSKDALLTKIADAREELVDRGVDLEEEEDKKYEAAEGKTDEKEPACPLCKEADPSDITAAGIEGTFLGDSCGLCHKCGKTFNLFTGEEIVEAKTSGSKKRRILNPQTKIDAKTAAAMKVGVKVEYERNARLWNLYLPISTGVNGSSTLLKSMSSKEFAQFSTAEFEALCVSLVKKAK